MATKAERFRYETERSKTSPAKPKKRASGPLRGQPLGRKAVFAFEETPAKTPPSRKSTRKSKHRQKAATALKGKTLLAKTAPTSRHDSGRTVTRSGSRR